MEISGLNTQQRKEFVMAQVFEKGHVLVKDLAGQMAVSEATVRRDLRVLADERKLVAGVRWGDADAKFRLLLSFQGDAKYRR